MYEVDERDVVVELKDIPQSSIGAPLPSVLAKEGCVILAYYVEERDPAWDGTTIRVIDPVTAEEPMALVRFKMPTAHMFGPPNDEAFAGHPLAKRGLHPYGVFRIQDSSWIRKLERMNSVHPFHKPERFWKKQHVVFAFHDSTFECICDSFDTTQTRGSMASAIPRMVELLDWRER